MIELNAATIAFLIFSVIAIGGGLGVVLNRNLFRGTIWLMVSLFGVAGLFVLLSAPFLAAIQILVYIGAIAILFSFAVMLTRGLTQIGARFNRMVPTALGAGALFIIIALGVIAPVWGSNPDTFLPVSDQVITTTELGEAFVSGDQLVLPFEVASLLLTAAMVGAIVIAREDD